MGKRWISVMCCCIMLVVCMKCGTNAVCEVSSDAEIIYDTKKNTDKTDDMQTDTVDTNSVIDDVDVDLTAFSKTMIYSEVCNILESPEQYIGKTVKMRGQFTILYDDSMKKRYYACMVQDATACCHCGIEFELTDGNYPEADADNPKEICVVGVFDTYSIGDDVYCTLRNAKLL